MKVISDEIYSAPVFISECADYDVGYLENIIQRAFSEIQISEDDIKGKKILLKPNLVLAKKPDFAATTHPAFIRACANVLIQMGALSLVIADSPGGPFNEGNLSSVYRICEINSLSDIKKLKINNDFSYVPAKTNGERLKKFHIIKAFDDADVIVDLCKLKTHNLTGMSCAVKNLFGLIPGVEKFEMHSTFPKIEDFSEMLVDLALFVLKNKKFIALCDGILSMEGNGPSHGIPRKAGLVLVSASPFAMDIAARRIIGVDPVLHVDAAAKRGLVPESADDINFVGGIACPALDFKKPDNSAGKFLKKLPDMFGGRFASFFESRPEIIKKKCVGCGVCVFSCPRHTIKLIIKHKKRKASISYNSCIHCYCCQELCPSGAVGTHRNFLIKLIH